MSDTGIFGDDPKPLSAGCPVKFEVIITAPVSLAAWSENWRRVSQQTVLHCGIGASGRITLLSQVCMRNQRKFKMSEDSQRPARALAVLVVSYRAASKLEKCLDSLAHYLPDHEIHVWDNSGPAFAEVRELAQRTAEVTWHFSDHNVGFAAAVNRLAATVPNHDLLLLNPDAELIGPLNGTRSAIRENGIAAAGPMARVEAKDAGRARLFARRSEPWDVALRKFTLLNVFGGATGLGSRLRGTPFCNLYREQPHEVSGYLSGACLAIRREAWDEVGCFDEEFFLYGEEAEWQGRATSAGWRLLLADEVDVCHDEMGTVISDAESWCRSKDLLRAGLALIVEYGFGMFVAELYLAIAAISDGVRSRIRAIRRAQTQDETIVVTADGTGQMLAVRVAAILRLASAGNSVVVVSLRRLGNLPRELPPAIRLVRAPYWWPWTALQGVPSTLVVGTTRRENVFARLFGLGRKKACITVEDAVLQFAPYSID